MHDDNNYAKTINLDIIGVRKIESVPIFQRLNSQMMKIIPVLGLDFSQANLTFDDDICLHRTKEDKPKIYMRIIDKFVEFRENPNQTR